MAVNAGVRDGLLARRTGRLDHRSAWTLALVAPAVLGLPCCFVMKGWLPAGTMTGMTLILVLLASSYVDVTSHRIPNWATYTGLFWVLTLNLGASCMTAWETTPVTENMPAQTLVGPAFFGAIGIGPSLLGALLCFLVMLVVYNLARGGAGDVKLATVIGATLGFQHGLLALAFSYILAGVAILSSAIWVLGPVLVVTALVRGLLAFFLPVAVRPPSPEQKAFLRKPTPLAPYFAMGTLLVMLEVFNP